MARPIRVSRQGLTCCPACQSFIQIAADVRQTACPFCQAVLVATPEATSKLGGLIRGALSTGRSGLLAASLLGLSVGAAACGDEEDPPAEDTSSADTSTTDGTSGTSGSTSDATTTTTEDIPTVADAAYGLPPDTITVEDTGPVAEYGIPPDAIEDSAEDVPTADYGLPPDAN